MSVCIACLIFSFKYLLTLLRMKRYSITNNNEVNQNKILKWEKFAMHIKIKKRIILIAFNRVQKKK